MSAWSHSKFQASQGYIDPISRKFVFLIQHSGNQGRRSLWIYDQPGLHRLSQQNRSICSPTKRVALYEHTFLSPSFRRATGRRHFGRCTLVCWWLNISKALHAVGHFLSSKCFAVLMPLYIVLGAFWSRQSWLSQLLSSSGTWWIRLLGTDWNRNSSLWKEAVLVVLVLVRSLLIPNTDVSVVGRPTQEYHRLKPTLATSQTTFQKIAIAGLERWLLG